MDDIRHGAFVTGRHIIVGGGGMLAPLSNVLQLFGLAGNNRLCLDAGDKNSYDPSIQTQWWADTSGGGNDFWRGGPDTGDMYEPAFNGIAGALDATNYWSSAGFGCFTWRYAGPSTLIPNSWSNMHRPGAKFTIFSWIRIPSTATGSLIVLFDDRKNADFSGPGVVFYLPGSSVGGPNPVGIAVSNTTGYFVNPVPFVPTGGSFGLAANQISMISATIDATAGSGFFGVNGSYQTFSANYSSASALPAPVTTPFIGASVQTSAFLPPGTRLYTLCIIEGVALTQDQVSNIFNAMRMRFGV